MPDYEYRCPECGRILVLMRKIDERDNPVKCSHSELGAEPVLMKRMISRGTGFMLKGGGWYRDGYGDVKPS